MPSNRHTRSVGRRALTVAGVALALVAAVLSASPEATAAVHDLEGVVRAKHSREPLVGATVEILELRRTARTDSRGRFKFKGVKAGTWNLLVSIKSYSDVTRAASVPGESLEFSMDLHFHDKPVLVTASPGPRDKMQVFQPTQVLSDEKLEQRATSSLGTTLQSEPGVSSSDLGTAPSRPVIRGLGGDRVLILEDGTRSGDVSSLSPDHAVAVNPAAAESVEVIRGPANLLYGSNAIGGVVNIINNEIPSVLLDRPAGSLTTSASSNTGELFGSLDFSASAGPVSFNAGLSRADAGEFATPAARAGNSRFDTTTFNGGVSFVGRGGFIGAAYRSYESDYGIPVSEDREPLRRGEPGIMIRAEQDSFKLQGEVTRGFGPFSGARFRASSRNWEHTEFEEDGEAATRFDQQTTELRAEMTHAAVGRWKGTFGLWYLDEELATEGEETVVPRADTRAWAAFVYEELALNAVKLLFGARYDSERVDPRGESIDPALSPLLLDGTPIPGPATERQDYASFSGAAGAILNPEGRWSVAANVSRNFKAPSGEELFSFGPHLSTQSFEVGNADLEKETSTGYDLSFRWHAGRFRGEVTAYRTEFHDFIFLAEEKAEDPNGNSVLTGGQPFPVTPPFVAVHTQSDAVFQGVEVHADFAILSHLHVEVTGDSVHATNEETGGALPRIPPMRAGLGVDWDTDLFGVGAEARYGAKQDRLTEFEEATNEYTVYNLFGHLQFPTGHVVHRFALRVDNLTDRLYRNHVSRVKELVPQIGRIGRLNYTLTF